MIMTIDEEVLEKLDNIIDIIPNVMESIDQALIDDGPHPLGQYRKITHQTYEYLNDSLYKCFKRLVKLKEVIQNNGLHGTIENKIFFKKGIDKIYFYLNKISLKNLADPTYNFTFYGPKESDEKKLTRALNVIESLTCSMSDDDE